MAIARETHIISSSPKSIEGAIEEGFNRARKTLRGITGIKVNEIDAKVENGKIVEYRVHMKLIFLLEG
jgi:dodecin